MNAFRASSFAATLALALSSAGCTHAVRESDPWNALFERREGYGWSGGDGAYSVSLPAGRTLWLFGDSVLSGVQGDRRNDLQHRFGNTIAVQQNPPSGEDPVDPGSLKFDWSAPSSSGWLPIFDASLVDSSIPDSLRQARAAKRNVLAWPLHGVVVGDDLLLFNSIVTTGDCESCGIFNFVVHGSMLSMISGVDRPYREWGFQSGVGWREDSRPRQRFVEPGRVSQAGGASLLWGLSVAGDPGNARALFVYGHRRQADTGELVVARVAGVETAVDAMDFSRWSYWDGRSWAPRPEDARGILANPAVELSVAPVPRVWDAGWAVVHAGSNLAATVEVALGPGATGPFSKRYTFHLADCPIDGFDPERPPLVYAVKAHPDLSTDDELLVSMVLVPVQRDASQPLERTHYYVPRFLRLPWQEILGNPRSSPERCDRDDALPKAS